MLNSVFDPQKNASLTLPGGLLSASCNINKNFGAYVGLQVGPELATGFEGKPFFVEVQHKSHLKTILRGFWKGFGKGFEVVLGWIFWWNSIRLRVFPPACSEIYICNIRTTMHNANDIGPRSSRFCDQPQIFQILCKLEKLLWLQNDECDISVVHCSSYIADVNIWTGWWGHTKRIE